MKLWQQATVAAFLIAGTGLVWANYVPSAAPILARLGLPVSERAGPADPSGGFGRGGGSVEVVGVPVAEDRAYDRVSAIGDGRARRSVVVTPLASGRIVEIAVAPGAMVVAGEPIARLDSDLEALQVERAALVRRDAEVTLERVEQLRARGAATDVQESEARLALERARIEERDAALALERRTITAPIDGVIGLLPVEVGLQAGTSDEIATIEDRASLIVEFRVPERVVAALDIGMPVEVSALARPDLALEGRITALDNRIDPQSRTLRVQASVPNDGDRLRAGMAFAIALSLPGETFPAVDPLAIRWGGEGSYVWVARDGKAERLPVRIVQRNAENVLVTGEFEPGERVVTEGVQRLRIGGAMQFRGDPPPAEAAGQGIGVSRADRALSGG
jgi:RND family efflux transporter MFP subunit